MAEVLRANTTLNMVMEESAELLLYLKWLTLTQLRIFLAQKKSSPWIKDFVLLSKLQTERVAYKSDIVHLQFKLLAAQVRADSELKAVVNKTANNRNYFPFLTKFDKCLLG